MTKSKLTIKIDSSDLDYIMKKRGHESVDDLFDQLVADEIHRLGNSEELKEIAMAKATNLDSYRIGEQHGPGQPLWRKTHLNMRYLELEYVMRQTGLKTEEEAVNHCIVKEKDNLVISENLPEIMGAFNYPDLD